jgi:hypothetical protein
MNLRGGFAGKKQAEILAMAEQGVNSSDVGEAAFWSRNFKAQFNAAVKGPVTEQTNALIDFDRVAAVTDRRGACQSPRR